ncbi:MAG: glycoside hydrolase family 2 TIM barrel-domain containing protein [Acidobacteriota bacterium]
MPDFTLTFDPASARVTQSLNGLWEIAPGDEARPLEEFTRVIPVPSLVDCAEPSYEWQRYDYHWYRARFSVRGEGELRSLFLKLRHSMYTTAVWINDEPAGSSISCYTPQLYRIDESYRDGAPNEILIRVGARQTLPPESAAGKDQERSAFIPGIWGDVELSASGEVRITSIQTIPHIRRSVAEVRVRIENISSSSRHCSVVAAIQERASKRPASDLIPKEVALSAYGAECVTFQIPIEPLRLWSPESPFLYTVHVTVQESSQLHDSDRASFGMREFSIEGPDFLLNGRKIMLRGGNIALHRFFSDRMRKLLPWDEEWIRKVLVDIPRAHHFNFFRNHIGPLYHRWYDIADEHGILLQNEWPFWGSTGSKEEIRKEFREWILDACNHPSIVIWDPLNESSDDVIRYEIVPEMKKLDPTRPWESVDFFEEHPYIYSLGMVLNGRAFGFARPLDEIARSATPSMVNEFLWWWLDAANAPAPLMKGITERWLGRTWSREELIERQSFLACELVELFRRLRVRAIQPFVYISNNDGPTGNWFEGDIALARPKPVMKALANAFHPFGVSIELWDRHFAAGERREVRVFLFNDTPSEKRGVLRVWIRPEGAPGETNPPGDEQTLSVSVKAGETVIVPVTLELPASAGTYMLKAELTAVDEVSIFSSLAASASEPETKASDAWSEKVLHVFEPVVMPQHIRQSELAVWDPSGELQAFLGLPLKPCAISNATGIVLTHGAVIAHAEYQKLLPELSTFVRRGGTLIVIEPEYRTTGSVSVALLQDVELRITQRKDLDKGGYDSYVFPEDESHPVWKGITKEHLKMFNGALGGEVVSEHDIDVSVHCRTLASCGLGLGVKAMIEIPHAKGRVIVSRLQCRGRLVARQGSPDALYARRTDPVMQRLVLNLIDYGLGAPVPAPTL